MATPEDFWQLYLDRVKPVDGESFGRSLDALWDALSAGGPGSPGGCWIEVRNIERLRSHAAGFVRSLQRIATDLESAKADVSLLVLEQFTEEGVPRGRLYQHSEFLSRELSGTTVQALLSWSPNEGRSDMLWLLPEGRAWQRLWLEAGLAFWDEYEAFEAFEAFEDVRSEIVDVGARSDLVGDAVESVEARCGGDHWCLEIRLASGRRVRLDAEDARDFDAEVRLQVLGPSIP